MRAAWWLVVVAGCASARTADPIDAAVDDAAIDGAEIDSAVADAATDAATDSATDARMVDAATVDAAAIDAAVIDAAMIDARVIDAPIDAPIDAACTPTWTNLLGNGGFETAIVPWTQTSLIIRTSAQMPFAPQAGTYAALFGASNNANDVLVQTVTIPASATGLRMRGFDCNVTEDLITPTNDTFKVTLETTDGAVLETLRDINASSVAPICAWLPFTWTATAAHPGQTVVVRFQGRTNLALLTRFAVDSLALEALACP